REPILNVVSSSCRVSFSPNGLGSATTARHLWRGRGSCILRRRKGHPDGEPENAIAHHLAEGSRYGTAPALRRHEAGYRCELPGLHQCSPGRRAARPVESLVARSKIRKA